MLNMAQILINHYNTGVKVSEKKLVFLQLKLHKQVLLKDGSNWILILLSSSVAFELLTPAIQVAGR